MTSVFDSLPGLDVAVGDIGKAFAKLWDDASASGGPSPAELKATQLNLVLHLGFATTAAEAVAQFETAKSFSQHHPARVVILCPLPEGDAATEMRAKIYGECFLGKTKGDTRCVEFVALSYPMSARRFLESQVSVCLSTDLPLYYWVHRFSASSRLADYQYLLRRSKRFIFDTAVAPADVLTHAWPNPENLRDLAHARLLHVRQSLGQFLAGCAPEDLVAGLDQVVVTHGPAQAAEGGALARWVEERLRACGWQPPVSDAAPVRVEAGGARDASLALHFGYAAGAGKRFDWWADFAQASARFEADLCRGPVKIAAAVNLLAPDAALSEAMFF